jgi:hypothetical protein
MPNHEAIIDHCFVFLRWRMIALDHSLWARESDVSVLGRTDALTRLHQENVSRFRATVPEYARQHRTGENSTGFGPCNVVTWRCSGVS